MYFRVLGPLEVTHDANSLPLAPRQRVVLSMLLLEPNRVVAVDRLVDAVWNASPPSTAREQIQICVSAIRRTLAGAGLPNAIVTRAPGYAIRCTRDHLDLLAFEDLVATGRQAVSQGRHAEAAAAFEHALGLWRGAPLAGVASALVQSIGVPLAERRLAVLEEYMAAQLLLDRQHELISDLLELVAANPFRERLRAQLMTALHRAGRRAEALQTYRSGRQLLVDKLGLEPGEELRRVERAVLAGDATTVPGAAAPTPEHRQPHVVPRLLPTDIGDFVGHADDIERVRTALATPRAGCRAVRVAAVAGRPWIGKTTFAVHVAHSLSDEFADGQLFVRLGGGRGAALSTGAVLERFLRALGVADRAIPEGTDERAEMFRGLLAERRVLVVLDDAASERQVRPLLPGNPDCAVIVTSRARLAGLAGATQCDIGPLSEPESVTLLTGTLGPDRAHAEAKDVTALARTCAGEPLALRLAAARLTARPHWPVATLVTRLCDDARLLSELSCDGHDLAAAISDVHDRLDPAAQRLMRRISLLGRTGFSAWMCAPLLDMPDEQADEALAELVDAGLLDIERRPDGVLFHLGGLLWTFARCMLLAHETPATQAETLRRVFGTRLFLATEPRVVPTGDPICRAG